MSADGRSIRSVWVVGAGIVGLSAALAFARALPDIRVRLIATPADPFALADRIGLSLPAIHVFHAAIGLDELQLVREGIAFHHLGTTFEGWTADGSTWRHVFGEYGLAASGVPFHQIWARLRRSRLAEPFDRYAAAALLVDAGKFVHPQEDPRSPLSNYLYGLRLDPEAYQARLAAQVDKMGIEIIDGVIAGLDRRQDGGVAAVRLADGRAIEADLFLDCAGPSAPLRSVIDDEFEDWAKYLPCDRFTLGVAARPAAPLPADQVKAVDEGWLWVSTLPRHLASGMAWDSKAASEADAARVLEKECQVAAAEVVVIRTGRRLAPWKYNVLALGDSAVVGDPLHGPGLYLAQSAILRALELLPGRDCHPLELREYNRRTAQQTARLRDFQSLHYLRCGRSDGEFWAWASNRTVSDDLARTLDQYESRGRLPFYEEESFDAQSWLAVFGGLERLPEMIDPASDRVDPDRAKQAMRDYAARLAALPAGLPFYPDYLRRMADRPS